MISCQQVCYRLAIFYLRWGGIQERRRSYRQRLCPERQRKRVHYVNPLSKRNGKGKGEDFGSFPAYVHWQKNTTSRSDNRLRRRTGRLVMTRCRKQGHCFKVERREGYCSTKYGDSKGYWPRPYRPPPVADGDGDSGNSTAAGKHYRGLLQPERERRQEKRTAIYLSVHGSSSKRKRASAVVRGGITTATAPAIKASSVVGYR